LDWKEEGRAGGTRIGLTRANQIANGDSLSADTVKRMYSFFSRHEVDKEAEGFSEGEEGFPSPGRVAWDLWGGDAGFSWSRDLAEDLAEGEDPEDDDEDDVERSQKENTQMEEEVKTQDIITEEQPAEITEVAKAEAEETAPAVEETEKSEELVDAEVVENDSVTKADLTNLGDRVNALSESVEKLAEQLTVVQDALTKSTEAEVVAEVAEEVGKSVSSNCSCGGQCDGSCLQTNIIKSAVLAALEPVIARLDRLENEPVDKSYAVMKNKYDDLPFAEKAAREIDETGGREAIRKALELAFKGM